MLGPILRYMLDPHTTLSHYASRYGDPFYLPVPGTRGAVVTGRPEGIREIFGAHPDTFEPFASEAHRQVMGARGFFARAGSRQRAARKLVQPAMVGAALRACGPALQSAVDRVTRDRRTEDIVDFRVLAKTIALDAVSAALFGCRAPVLAERLKRAFADGLERTHPAPLYLPFLRHEFGGHGPWARAMTMLRETMALLADEIRTRQATEPGDGITGSLLQARYDDGSTIDPEEIRDLLYDLAIAGYDTTAGALVWAAHDIVNTSGVQSRLAGELALLGEPPTPDELAGLAYLDAVCNETLRRRPLLVLVSRRLRQPFTLLGHELPAGNGVSVAIGIAHFREDVYPEPLSFVPERFLSRSFSPFEFLPFGGGAKRCLGASLALYEMKVVLGTLFSRFELSAVDRSPARPRPQGVSISPSRPVRMRMKPRHR